MTQLDDITIEVNIVNVVAQLKFPKPINLIKVAKENTGIVEYDERIRFCRMRTQNNHGVITITKRGFNIVGARSAEEAKEELYNALKLVKIFYIGD